MSKLTDNQIKHVAKLAKLTLTDEEIKKFQGQLSNILSHIDELSKVDTTGVEPTSQTTGLTNVFKKDEIDPLRIMPVDAVLSNTKNKLNNYFVVNAVIDKDQ